MKRKAGLIAIFTSLLLIFAFTAVGTKAQATSYNHLFRYGRANRYTTPKKMRGVWVSKDKDNLYSKVVIRKHKISFKPQAKADGFNIGVKGTWTLYHQLKGWRKNKSENYLDFAQRYAYVAHWVHAMNKKGMYLNFSWTYPFDSDATGTFNRSGNKLIFENKNQKFAFNRIK